MIILYVPKNPASKNIAAKLIEKSRLNPLPTDYQLKEVDAPTVLDIPTDLDHDLTLVLSTHRSKVPGRCLTAHVPGNWNEAGMGGEPRTLNIVDARTLKILIQALAREGARIGWDVSLEADHHGPTCSRPILFVEIGNSEAEWENKDAIEAVANAVIETVKIKTTQDSRLKTVFAIGGGHYPKTFTKIEIEDQNLAIGHICPKYSIDSLDEDTFKQAIEKNVERASLVLISKDEVNAKQREKVIAFAEKFGIECKII